MENSQLNRLNMKIKYALIFAVMLAFIACNTKEENKNTTEIGQLETENQNFDFGVWITSQKDKSEEAYRKAITFDPDFVLGNGIVGKITTNLEERKAILKELESKKVSVSNDERLLLDDLLLVLKLFNSRDQNIKLDNQFIKNFYESSEIGMRTFIHKYPHESYIKAEYIEVLHANHGAQTALDSIDALATPHQKKLPFYLSYAAFLESELGNYKKALVKAKQLKQAINN